MAPKSNMRRSKKGSRGHRGARGSAEPPLGEASDGGRANGIQLDDGTAYPLEGQPPLAVSKGWGIVPGWQP